MRITKPTGILIVLTVAAALIIVPACSITDRSETEIMFAGCGADEKPLRLHVLAASDEPFDQSVKLAVRDRVLEYLDCVISDCNSKEEALTAIGSRLPQIESVCDTCLANCGAAYRASAALETADFPEISYGGAVLAAGEYDALRIVLGEGRGHNWWCVLFPPLCFVDMAAAVDEEAAVAAWADMNADENEDIDKYRISWKLADVFCKR